MSDASEPSPPGSLPPARPARTKRRVLVFTRTEPCGTPSPNNRDSAHPQLNTDPSPRRPFVTRPAANPPDLPPWRLGSQANQLAIDFVFENPADGKLWDSDAMGLLYGPYTKRVDTSYCHYGTPYRKRTTFFTSLTNLKLVAACPGNPCPHASRHATGVADCTSQVQNSIPCGIVWSVLDAWLAKDAACVHQVGRDYDYFVVLDVFKGFGSVQKAVNEYDKSRDILYVGNDIVPSRADDADSLSFDVSKPPQFEILLDWALVKLRQRIARMQGVFDDETPPIVDHGCVRMLLWLSTPCDTYGPQGMSRHGRCSGELSAKAKLHDAMNLFLAQWLLKHALTPPVS